MSIRDMVLDSLGFVTDEDRQKWEAHEKSMDNERAKEDKVSVGKASFEGVSSAVINYGGEAARRRLSAEEHRSSDMRDDTKKRVIEINEKTSRREAYDDEMEF